MSGLSFECVSLQHWLSASDRVIQRYDSHFPQAFFCSLELLRCLGILRPRDQWF